jgi:hypothetical protein
MRSACRGCGACAIFFIGPSCICIGTGPIQRPAVAIVRRPPVAPAPASAATAAGRRGRCSLSSRAIGDQPTVRGPKSSQSAAVDRDGVTFRPDCQFVWRSAGNRLRGAGECSGGGLIADGARDHTVDHPDDRRQMRTTRKWRPSGSRLNAAAADSSEKKKEKKRQQLHAIWYLHASQG